MSMSAKDALSWHATAADTIGCDVYGDGLAHKRFDTKRPLFLLVLDNKRNSCKFIGTVRAVFGVDICP